MKPRFTLAVVSVLCGSIGLALVAAPSGPPAARFVPAAVRCDGVEVLSAGTSDDGHPDADEVWNYLRGLEFKPTADFGRLGEPSADVPWRIPALDPSRKDPLPARFQLEIGYGGRVELRELLLVPTDATRSTWRIAPDEIERWFRHRSITRSEAAELRDPKRKK